MQRRAFLGTALAAGLSGLAGCGRPAHLTRPPEVPKQRLRENGWERRNAFTTKLFDRTIDRQRVVADAHTVRYSNEAMRERVRERTFGQVDASFGRFFATRVRTDPEITSFSQSTRDDTMQAIERKSVSLFLDWVRDEGIQEPMQTGTGTISVASGATARRIDFEGKRPMKEIPISIPKTESVTVDLNPVTVNGYLAIWRDGDRILVTGGTHPAENADEVTTERIAPGIQMSVQVDLGFTPAEYREELFGLMKRVG